MTIDQSAVQGEPGTGFEKRGSKGPFECSNCEYFKNDACHNKIMMAHSKQPKYKDGSVKVDADDCCEYVERKGDEPAWKTSFVKLGSVSHGKNG